MQKNGQEDKFVKGGPGSGRYPKGSGEDNTVEIPKFKNTNEAMAYGKANVGNKKVIDELKLRYKAKQAETKRILDLPLDQQTDELLQSGMNEAVVGQFYREAYETAEGTLDTHGLVKADESKILAVDYHGTLMVNNLPNLALITKLWAYKTAGWHIIIYTSGLTENPSIIHGIRDWLAVNKVPYDEIWQRQGKPDATFYIDDKAFRPEEVV